MCRDPRRRGASERPRREQGGRLGHSLFGRFPDALAVVDRSRNIGALALVRARVAGMSAAYSPGLAAHGAARLFAGDAKTDERDAMAIAKTALGIPDALLPVGDPGPTIAAARALAAQRNFLTCENTRNKNRLRSILLESRSAFEALVDLSDGPRLRLMASLGGAWSVADAGPRRAAALTRGAAHGKIEAPVRSTASSTRPDAAAVAAEDRAVKLLARRISGNSAEIEASRAEISALLEGDDTYRCLPTVPGIGPKAASELAISIDIEDFPSHDGLASHCGPAPRDRQSATSISSVTASRQGNKRLKNLLILSCNCLTRTERRWGDYYARCRERGMSHGKALKALARNRRRALNRRERAARPRRRPRGGRRAGKAKKKRGPGGPRSAPIWKCRPPVSGALLSHGLPPQYHRRSAA